MDNKRHIKPLFQPVKYISKLAISVLYPLAYRKATFSYTKFIVFATVVLFFFISTASKPLPHHDVLKTKLCDNYIKINGSTNVNHFHFEQNLEGQDNMINEKQNTLVLKIPAHDFEPSNPMMYKDFLEFIKAGDYPFIKIKLFMNKTRLPAGPSSGVISPEIEIGLAGKSQIYQITGKVEECRKKFTHISGKVSLDMNDFGLEPPSKFMGMVKVSNEVFINFGLTLKNERE